MSDGGFCPICDKYIGKRPYAGHKDKPSSSTVAGMWDDGKAGGMSWAASLLATTVAVHEPDRWSHLSTDKCGHTKDTICPACRMVRAEFQKIWDHKRDRGTHCHHLIEERIRGEVIDIDEESAPYLEAGQQFCVDAEPDWIEIERTVLYAEPVSHSYRGTFDWIATINCPSCPEGTRCKWMGDWKTGSYKPAEQALQMSAYRYAQHLTRWENGKENIEGPVPQVRHTGVVLLDGDGRYQLIELPANGDAFGTFLRMRDVWGWHKQMKKWEREHPLPLHTPADNELTIENELKGAA